MNSWTYKDFPFEEIPEGVKAFVYKIEIADKYYYGKKQFYKSIKRPPLKGYKRHRRDTVESNWKKYCSSSDDVKNLVGQGQVPERIVLRLCSSLKEATYWENKILFQCLSDERCLNGNIQGKFFKEEVTKWEINSG